MAVAVLSFLSSGLFSIVSAEPEVDEEFRSSFEESNKAMFKIRFPTDLEFSKDNKLLLIADKEGELWVLEDFDGDDKPKSTLAVDLSDRMCFNGERGLGSAAFHPEYPDEPYVYLHYNYDKYDDCYTGENEPNMERGSINRLSRFVLDPDSKKINLKTEEVFIETARSPRHNHNAGDIAFGKDGLLYSTLGDGGTRVWKNDDGVYYAQALDNLFGKIIRLTDDGKIPNTNPFTPRRGYPDSVLCGKMEGESKDTEVPCQEIFASGLRNPFRFAFDPNGEDTRFFINDVGRSDWERIVEGKKGVDYGYPIQDGPCVKISSRDLDATCEPNQYTRQDVFWYEHDEEEGGAVVGGAFYPEGAGWPKSFSGSYFFSEYAQGGIYRITEEKGCSWPKCDPPVPEYQAKVLSEAQKVTSMQFGPYKGGTALYYVTRGNDGSRDTAGLHRLSYTGSRNRSPTAVIKADVKFGFSPLVVTFQSRRSSDPDDDELSFTWDLDGDGLLDSTDPSPSFTYETAGTYTATLFVEDSKGLKDSASVRIEVDNTPPNVLIESPPEGTLFAVGDKFELVGSAFDVEDGELPSESLTWEVRQHHNTHWHPFLDPTEGNFLDLDGAPAPEDFDASTTSYLEILLTATDSAGLTTTITRNIMPKMSELTLISEPAGLQITAYGDTFTTPAKITTWENHKFEIEAANQCVTEPLIWDRWSDGGDQIHNYIVDSTSSNLVATFVQAPGPSSIKCEGNAPAPAPVPPAILCEDSHPSCDGWSKLTPSECTANPEYMIANCAKSCGACSPAPAPVAVPPAILCEDSHPSCDGWSKLTPSECIANPEYMIANCAKSCGACAT